MLTSGGSCSDKEGIKLDLNSDGLSMAENESFNTKIIMAAADREQWYDGVQLPKIQDDYRLHLSCVRNIFDALVKRGLIVPDPYKKDNKVTSIQSPDTTPFNDNERSQILGIRLSNYESMVDYVCNYMRFSVEMLNIESIKKMLELNNAFSWNNLSQNSTRCNTRALAISLNELKSNADQLTVSMIKDNTLKTQNAMEEITKVLKDLAEFQRERYKLEIRKTILENSAFDKGKAYASTAGMVGEIRRLFPSCMPRRPVNAELINELSLEETAPNKEELQAALLAKIQVKVESTESKVQKVDIHAILMESLRLVGTTYDSYKVVLDKVIANHDVLQSGKKSFQEKLKKLLRNLFGLEEPSVDYEVVITDLQSTVSKSSGKDMYVMTAYIVLAYDNEEKTLICDKRRLYKAGEYQMQEVRDALTACVAEEIAKSGEQILFLTDEILENTLRGKQVVISADIVRGSNGQLQITLLF